jgi:PAS domain S-box-containing protein
MGKSSGHGLAVDARQAQRPLSESAGPTEKLLQAILSISRCATLEEALEPLLNAALDITRMDGGGVYWVEGDVAVLRHHRGLPEAFIRDVMRMPLTRAPIQTLLHQQEPVEVAEMSPVMRELCRRHGIRHAFSFPLRAKETVFGYLNVGSTRVEEPARADLLALQVLVSQMEALFCRLYDAKAVRESEERYRTLWNSALDGIVLHDLLFSPRKGSIIDMNECACRMLGYTHEEMLTLSPFDIVAEEEKQRIPELAARVRQAGRMLFEVTLVSKDGRHIPVEVNSSVVHFAGRPVALAILRDVTERKRAAEALRESEERFRAFMNNSPAVEWMKDEQGRIVYLSETYEKRLGVRFEDWRGKTDFELWPPEVAREFRKNDLEVLRTGRTLEAVEESPAPDGGRCYWWIFKFPVRDASGRKFVGGIGVDITERRRMEDMLRRMNDRLEEEVQARTSELNHTIDRLQKLTLELAQAEDRERKRLAEFLHDDLQQMLAAVKFQVSILAGRIQGDEAVRENVKYVKQILKDAIEKSRNLSRELCPPVLYQGSLEDLCHCLASQMESKHGLAVQLEIRGGVNSGSEPARSFLYRAVQELLFNVVKHARVREAKLRLQRVRNELWLTVSDKGSGFDTESLDQTGGYGLMSIRERAELLGGRMKIKSIPGRGSIFFVAIPDSGA